MKRAQRFFWFGLGLAASLSCGKVRPDEAAGGETHWLKHCSSDAECGGELSCVCRVCTEVCTDDASCAQIDERAVCLDRQQTSYGEACAGGAPAALCVEKPEEATTGPVEIFGRRFGDGLCFGPSELAGTSASAGQGCDDALTHAYGPDDSCWLFSNGCIPDGFTLVDTSGVGPAFGCWSTTETCPLTVPCSANQIPSPSGCLSCDAARDRHTDYVTTAAANNGWRSCNSDLDCVVEEWSTACDGHCPMPLANSSVEAFRAALPELAGEYCSDPGAWQASSCFARDVDCPNVPICVAGQCERTGVACADRTLEGCAYDGNCVVSGGFPYDPGLACFENDLVSLACVDPDLSCPPTITMGLDQGGNCFSFGNCLPPGFARAPDDHPCVPAPFCAAQ